MNPKVVEAFLGVQIVRLFLIAECLEEGMALLFAAAGPSF